VLEVLISVDGWCELSVACFDFEGDVRMVLYENDAKYIQALGGRGWGRLTEDFALGNRGCVVCYHRNT
jgi:hypothetical protein